MIKKDQEFIKIETRQLSSAGILGFAGRLESKYEIDFETACDFAQYILHLNLNLDSLGGKTIFDAGSGGVNFRKVLEKAGISCRVTNLDKSDSHKDNADVRGDTYRLPFKDRSFDMVILRCASPIMDTRGAGSFGRVSGIIEEYLRVAKDGGSIKVYPVGGYDKRFNRSINKRIEDMERIIIDCLVKYKQTHGESEMKIMRFKDSDSGYSDLLEIRK